MLVTAAGLRLAANSWVWAKLATSIHEKYAVDVEIDDLSLSLWSGEATASGLRITERGRVLIEAQSVAMSATVPDLVAGVYDFRSLVVRRPVFHVVVEQGDQTNFSRIYAARRPGEGPASFVRFGDGRVADGRLVLDDAVTDPSNPAQFVVEDISLALSDLQVSGPPRSKDFGDIRLDGRLVQKGGPARITLVGWAQPLTDEPTIALHAAVTGLDLSQMPHYVSSATRWALGGDVLHIVGTLNAVQGVIAGGAIVGEVAATGKKLPLRVGGTTSSPVFDGESKMAVIFKLPFARFGRLGDVAKTSATGRLGSGFKEAGKSMASGFTGGYEDLAHLDPLGALSSAGSGVAGGLKSVVDGVVGGVKRLFGGGDSAADDAEQAELQQAEFARTHAERRRAMLQAALESVKDVAGERRERLQRELAAPAE